MSDGCLGSRLFRGDEGAGRALKLLGSVRGPGQLIHRSGIHGLGASVPARMRRVAPEKATRRRGPRRRVGLRSARRAIRARAGGAILWVRIRKRRFSRLSQELGYDDRPSSRRGTPRRAGRGVIAAARRGGSGPKPARGQEREDRPRSRKPTRGPRGACRHASRHSGVLDLPGPNACDQSRSRRVCQ